MFRTLSFVSFVGGAALASSTPSPFYDLGVADQVDTLNPTPDTVDVTGAATVGANFTVDTSTFHVDSVNNRVGINDATPDYLLDVEGICYVGTQLLVGSAGALVDANSTFVSVAQGAIYIDYAGAANVGIYDDTPDALLDVAGTLQVDGAVTLASTLTSSRTTDLGWHIVSAANQACNTTCTSAAVFGWDGTTPVNHDDATADTCLCAGAN